MKSQFLTLRSTATDDLSTAGADGVLAWVDFRASRSPSGRPAPQAAGQAGSAGERRRPDRPLTWCARSTRSFPMPSRTAAFPKGMEPEIRKGAMQMMVFEELVYQEAERRKMYGPAREDGPGDGAVPQAVQEPGRVPGVHEDGTGRIAGVAARRTFGVRC